MIVLGGLDGAGGTDTDVYALDLSASAPTTWEVLTVSGGPPTFREGHFGIWDSLNQQMIIYGGEDEFATPNAEVWAMTFLPSPAWVPLSPTTSAGDRFYGTAIYDPVDLEMIVFGGVPDDSLTTPYDDTWSLNLGP